VSDSPPVSAIDSNVILRYLLRDHPALSPKARTILEGVETGEACVVCDPVNLSEVVYVMLSRYDSNPAEVRRLLEPLLAARCFILPDKQHYRRALQLFAESIPHFGDACACAAALDECEGRLYSFDRKLSNIPGVERLESAT